MEKADWPDTDKSEWIKLEFFMDPDNLASGSKYSRKFYFFKDQYPEEWIKRLIAFREVENLMPMKKPADNTRMLRTLLKAQALSYFQHHLMRRLEAEDSQIPDNKLIKLLLRDVGLEYIPKRAIHMQNYYKSQQWGLYMGLNTSIQQFVESLNELNHYLLCFP
jgi:hypothetical protein